MTVTHLNSKFLTPKLIKFIILIFLILCATYIAHTYTYVNILIYYVMYVSRNIERVKIIIFFKLRYISSVLSIVRK